MKICRRHGHLRSSSAGKKGYHLVVIVIVVHGGVPNMAFEANLCNCLKSNPYDGVSTDTGLLETPSSN